MAGRRGPGDGNVRFRADGRWEARAVLEIGGVATRRSFFGKTRREAADKMAAAQEAARSGLPVPGRKLTVGAYLDTWLRDAARPTVRSRTAETYEMIVRVHLTPGLGRHRLADLRPEQVQAFLNSKVASGLSPRTVNHLRAVLRRALNQALRWGLVQRNVAVLVQPPRVPHAEVTLCRSSRRRNSSSTSAVTASRPSMC